jgi:eukaryotic-like serine/threonine-protein kinase
LTASTDIYSLGAILYELLTGRPPFVGVQPFEVLSQVVADEPVRPSQLVRHIPNDLETICLKCLEKSPVRRYATAGALAEDLQRYLTDQPIVARHTMMLERGWRWCRRNPVKTTLTALAASLLLMVASLSSVYSFMLSSQLELTSKSEITEKSLKIQALEQLWKSSISQADALRTSRQVGQRFESLQAIEAARELGNSIPFEPNQIDRMRSATIAALALSDMRIDRQWSKPWPEWVNLQSFDDELTVCAYLLEPSSAVVQRIGDGVELARIENVRPESKLVLSRDGTKLAIFNDQCHVYLLNSDSHEMIFESTSGGPWTFSDDGSQLLGTDGDGQMLIVDPHMPQTRKIIGHLRGKHFISMSPDSKSAAIWMDHSIQVVDFGTGKVVLRVAPPGLPAYQSFAWHPNSKLLAVRSDDHGIELWDVAGGERLKTIPAYGPCSFVFDVHGNRLLTNQIWNDHLQLWIVSSGELEFSQKGLQLHKLAAAPAGGFHLLQSLDRRTVASISIACPNVYQTIPALRKDSAVHGVPDMSYSPDGQLLAYSGRGVLEIFETQTMTSLASVASPACFLRFDSDGSLFTSNDFGIDKDGMIERGLNRWQLKSTNESDSSSKFTFGPPEVVFDPQVDFADAPFDVGRQGGMIAVPLVDGVSVWSSEHEKSIRTQAKHNDVRRVSISPDGKRVASAGWNSGNVCIWDAATGQLQHTILQPTICTAQFSPDGTILATNAGEITAWDTQSWTERYKIKMDGKPNSGVSVCFSPDSKMIAASDSLGRTHLIEATSGRELLLLVGPTEKQINSFCFNPDGTQLAVLREGGTAHVWNLDVIQAELNARNLSLETGGEIVPQNQEKQRVALSTAHMTRPKFLKVEIQFDERFRQLEANQYIAQADLAAARFDFDSARVAIARALALKPQNPKACNRLAWLLATGPEPLRNPDKAMELAHSAVQQCTETERGFYTNTLGVAQYRAGKFEDALGMLKRSMAVQTPEFQAFDLYFLSMCSSKLGDSIAARDFFDRAELLKAQFRPSLPFDQQVALDQFSDEAKPR